MIQAPYSSFKTMPDGSSSHFATSFIPAGTVILNQTGNTSQKHGTVHSIQVTPDLHVDTLAPLRFTNHSCNANSRIVIETTPEISIKLIALRDINEGQAVTYPYYTSEYKMVAPFDCQCGHGKCLGKVQGYYFLEDKSMVPDTLLSSCVVTLRDQESRK
ncbi:uncharacterized protein LOC141904269 [Tubulanus polymorphus]|uniref:uncharacterized protein LOC141904269 n=1 Tax=Tubulanus polymorphus TaxID=672921 RepID=UPI003DA30ED8